MSMSSIKKFYGILHGAVFIFLSLGTIETFACPCFNMGFLHSEFLEDKNTKCHIYKEGNIIYKIDIFDEQHSASSTHTSCSLNTEYHDVNTQYGMFYSDNHSDCIREILDACNRLRINTQQRDF